MDFEYIHQELAKPNITLTLLHHEYVREAHNAPKIPYAYRTFAEHYRDYAMKYRLYNKHIKISMFDKEPI